MIVIVKHSLEMFNNNHQENRVGENFADFNNIFKKNFLKLEQKSQ